MLFLTSYLCDLVKQHPTSTNFDHMDQIGGFMVVWTPGLFIRFLKTKADYNWNYHNIITIMKVAIMKCPIVSTA